MIVEISKPFFYRQSAAQLRSKRGVIDSIRDWWAGSSTPYPFTLDRR